MKTPTFRPPPAVRIGLALGVITLALYLPALRHEFVAYDDQQYVTENAHVQAGLTAGSVAWAFGFHADNWHPLTWLSHMLDCQVYGLNAAGHHLTSLLLHAASTVLLFLALRRLTGATWRSAAVAALFGWHPLHVESVAWIAERKDVLCAFFWMLTLLAYARYAEKSGVWSLESEVRAEGAVGKRGIPTAPGSSRDAASWYALTLLVFAMALMSKPMAVTLPCVLLLLDFWPLNRLSEPGNRKANLGRALLEKVPFFALSAAACALTIHAQESAMVSTAGLPLFQRFAHALAAYTHYVAVMFVPQGLAVYYPYQIGIATGRIVLCGAFLVLATLLALRFSSQRPWFGVGWLWFLGTLVPVIGLVQVGDQAWADRYTYLPLIGLFIALVWGAAGALKEKLQTPNLNLQTSSNSKTPIPTAAPALKAVCFIALGIAMLITTSLQLRHWRNTRTLFEHAERVIPNNYMAITMLGSLLAQEGKLDEAIVRYREALRLKPGYPQAHFFLGNAFDQQGQLDAAITEYQQALWSASLRGPTHLLLGPALGKLNRLEEAANQYLAALKLDPDSAIAHNNLARLLHTQGRLDQAIEHYNAAVKHDPKLAQAHNNLGILLLQQRRLAAGTAELREALRWNPTNAESQFNLALALNQQAQWPEAVEWFRKTVGAGFNDANAHCQFALALAKSGQTREAMSHFAAALLAQPDSLEALDGLSWILATDGNPEFRNGTEAVRMAERACDLTGRKDPVKLKTLAAAYAEAGRFPEAIAVAQNVLGEKAPADRKELSRDWEAMLENFKANKPWRTTRL